MLLREEEDAMRTKLPALFVGVSLLLAGAPVLAHHTFSAEFDPRQPVKLTGTVTRVEWINPHAWIFIDVKRPDGTVENWGVETGAPFALTRRGADRSTFSIGLVIEVMGYRAKNGSTRVNGEEVKLPNGKSLFLGSSAGDAPYAARRRALDKENEAK